MANTSDSESVFDRVRDRVAAALAPTQDDSASPQARDERPTVVGREEYREEVDAEQVETFVTEYYRNPLIRVPVQNFAADVTEPGVSVGVSLPDEDADLPTVEYNGRDQPLDEALSAWASNSFIDGFKFDGDFADLLEEAVKDRRGRRGTSVVEHAYDDPRERERLLGLKPLKTETVTAYTREGKAIVLRPDDDPGTFDTVAVRDYGDATRDEAPTTPAGKTAAIAQFDDVFGAEEREEIPFALDDVTISPHDADTGELFGRPDSAPVIERARALRKKLRYVDQSVINTAFGNILATVETQDEEVVKNVRDNLDVNVKDRGEDVDPETVSATNAPVDVTEVEGKVPDVTDVVQQEIEYILSAMPTPLYRVGFAGDINRDVTAEQGEDYRDAVKRERRRLEADFQDILERKAREFLHGDAHAEESLDVDVDLRIRPETSKSPLRDEEFDAAEFSELMSALSTAAGPKGGATEILPEDVIIETLLDMDAEAIQEAAPGDGQAPPITPPGESEPAVMEAFEEFTDADSSIAAGLADGDGPFDAIPVLPDGLQTLTRGWLIRWAEWVAADRPEIDESDRLVPTPRHASLDFNPALHPRDPETGEFVERPFDLPDDAPDFGERSVKETLEYLDDNGAAVDAVLDPDTEVTVDGVPEGATSLDEIPEDGDDGEGDTDTDTDTDTGGAPDGEGRTVSRSEIDSFKEDLEPGDRIQYDDGSESPPIEEVVEDDGTVAAIHEEGFVVEDSVLVGPDDGPDLTPEGETIQEDLGVQTVNLSGLGEGARQDLVDALRTEFDRDEDLRRLFETAGSVQTTPPSDLRNDDDRNAAAAFQGSTRTLYVNPESFNDELGSGGEIEPGGVILSTDRQKTIQHELGHARHFMKDAETFGEVRERGLTDAEKQLANEEVSGYAAYTPLEFVAEVHTGLRNGVDFDDEVRDLYEELNGPEVSANGN